MVLAGISSIPGKNSKERGMNLLKKTAFWTKRAVG